MRHRVNVICLCLLAVFAMFAAATAAMAANIDLVVRFDDSGVPEATCYEGPTPAVRHLLLVFDQAGALASQRELVPGVTTKLPELNATEAHVYVVTAFGADGAVLDGSEPESLGPNSEADYVGWSAGESAAPGLALLGGDASGFPFIYTQVQLTNPNPLCAPPTAADFRVYEDGVLQTDYFDVQLSGGSNLVDVVIIGDNSGSMSDDRASVRANIDSFAAGLESRGFNIRLAFVRFGQASGNGAPILTNNAGWAATSADFSARFLSAWTVDGGTEPGLQAVINAANGYTYRTGAVRIFLLITDEDSDGGDRTTACNLANANGITVHVAALCSYGSSMTHYCGTSGIAACTGGLVFNTRDNMSPVLSTIEQGFASVALVRYRAADTGVDSRQRAVRVELDTCDGILSTLWQYTPGQSPKIERTAATIALSDAAVVEHQAITLECYVFDSHAPLVNQVYVWYRTTGSSTYKSLAMNSMGASRWSVVVPAADVARNGLDYYIKASDGVQSVTSPAVDAVLLPHQIAVQPNYMPVIDHQSPGNVPPGVPVAIVATITDQTGTVANAKLRYRRVGDLLFTEALMSSAGSSYTASIPASAVTLGGVEYEIRATDSYGVTAVSGPHVLTVASGPQCVSYGVFDICADSITRQSGNIVEFSGNVHVNDILYFSGNLAVNEVNLTASGDCRIFLKGVPTLLGPIVDIELYAGAFEFALLRDDGEIAGFLADRADDVLALGGLDLDIDEIELIVDRVGVRIKGALGLPPLMGGAQITFDTLEITRQDGVQFDGCLTNIPAVTLPGRVGLSELELCYDSGENCFSGHAVASVKVVEIGGDLAVCNGRLRTVGLSVDVSPGVPIGTTGFSLTGGSGLVDKLDNPPVLIKLTVDISGGPEIAGEYVLAFEEVGLTIQYPDLIQGSGKMVIFGEDTATGTIWYGTDGNARSFGTTGHVDLANVLLVDTQARVNASTFQGSAEGILRIPNLQGWPYNLIGTAIGLPYDIGNADASIDLDRIQGRAKAVIPHAPDVGFAFRVTYTPNLIVELGTDYDDLVKVPLATTANGVKAIVPTDVVEIGPDVPLMIVVATGAESAPRIAAVAPDGLRFDEQSQALIGDARFGYLSSDETATTILIIAHPLQGSWQVSNESGTPADIEVRVQVPVPAVSVGAAGSAGSVLVTTQVTSARPARLDLYYDQDRSGYDGEPIVEGLEVAAGTHQYTWTAADVTSGSYFIHARLDDGRNVPARAYSVDPVTILAAGAPAAPVGLSATADGEGIMVTWSAVSGVEGYAVHYRRAGEPRYTNVRSLFGEAQALLDDLVAGHTYEIAVRAYGTNGVWGPLSEPVSAKRVSATGNNSPEILGTPARYLRFGDELGYQVGALDVDGDVLAYSLVNALPGMAVSADGLVTWVPVPGQVLYPRAVVVVSDGRGGEDRQEIQTQVVDRDFGVGALALDRRLYVGAAAQVRVDVVDHDLASQGATVVAICEATGSLFETVCGSLDADGGRFGGRIPLVAPGSMGPGLAVTEGCGIVVRYFDDTTASWIEERATWVQESPLSGSLDIDPDTLNQGSRGRFVSVFYEPPLPYESRSVDVSSVVIEGLLRPIAGMVEYVDRDGDGQAELAMKVDREAFQAVVSVGDEVDLSMSAVLYTELATIPILVGDQIRVIHPVVTSPHTGALLPIGQPVVLAWTLDSAVPVDMIRVSASLDGQVSWQELAVIPGADRQYIWDSPLVATESAFLMLDAYRDGVLAGTTSAGPFVIAGASAAGSELPTVLGITGITPNPFNPQTSIEFAVPERARVSLKVFDIGGRFVRTLVDADLEPGQHVAVWDGVDHRGARVGSGTYIVVVDNGTQKHMARATLLK